MRQQLAHFAKRWQPRNFPIPRKRAKSQHFRRFPNLARLLQSFGQQRFQGVATMTDTITSKLAALTLTVLVSATMVLGAVGPATALATTPIVSARAAA
jgi:hypothetical protein